MIKLVSIILISGIRYVLPTDSCIGSAGLADGLNASCPLPLLSALRAFKSNSFVWGTLLNLREFFEALTIQPVHSLAKSLVLCAVGEIKRIFKL